MDIKVYTKHLAVVFMLATAPVALVGCESTSESSSISFQQPAVSTRVAMHEHADEPVYDFWMDAYLGK